MPDMVLSKNGKRYTHEEWISMDTVEKDLLLSKYGPAYTYEAWNLHYGNRKIRK